jgi:hypothetical protein
MGHFLDLAKNVAIYESPKTGGTTLRIWLHYLLTGELVEAVRHGGYFHGTSRMLDHLRAHGYRLQTFVPPPTGPLVIRLVRDPLQRFCSLVRDKVMREGWHPPGHGPRDPVGEKQGPQLPFAEACECAMAFLTERCHAYRGGNTTGVDAEICYHFCPQVNHVGSQMEHEIDSPHALWVATAELSTLLKPRLEALYGMRLPDVHARDGRFLAFSEPCGPEAIPSHVKRRVLEFYAADMLLWAQVQLGTLHTARLSAGGNPRRQAGDRSPPS